MSTITTGIVIRIAIRKTKATLRPASEAEARATVRFLLRAITPDVVRLVGDMIEWCSPSKMRRL